MKSGLKTDHIASFDDKLLAVERSPVRKKLSYID